MQELNEIMEEIHRRLSGGQEHMVLEYEANVTEDPYAGTKSSTGQGY